MTNRSQPPTLRHRLAVACVTLFGLGLTALLTLGGLFSWYGRDLPDVHALKTSWSPPQTTRIFARDNTELAELFLERRTVVRLGELPNNLVRALLAAEDAEFYQHQGIDYPGMVRALAINISRGTIAQGASTITQQVVKNVLLTPERTFGRKVREVLLARRIEHELSKNEILFLYVNHIAFGHGRNGVEEAAQFYFGKHVADLTLGECALLAGIPKSPVHYSPRNNPEGALRRRRWILGQMVRNSFVTQAQADAAAEEPLHLAPAPEDAEGYAPEVVEIVRRTLESLAGGDAMRRGGYRIYTSIDPAMQRAARDALTRQLHAIDERHGYLGPLGLPGQRRPNGSGNVVRAERAPRDNRLLPGHMYSGVVEAVHDPDPATHTAGDLMVRVGDVVGRVGWNPEGRYVGHTTRPSEFAAAGAPIRVSVDQIATPAAVSAMHLELGPQAAMVALDPASREVLAMVGGYDAVAGMFNRATRAERQPGSAFKPILYSFALTSRRYTLASTIDPNPGCFGAGRNAWCPHESHAHAGVVEPPMRLRDALAQSRNMVAARLMEALGPPAVITHAQALGVHSTMPTDLSLALGSGTVTPIELTNTYATFAAQGQYQDWLLIRRVVDPSGHDLLIPPRAPPRSVLSPAEAFVITSAMRSVIEQGTGRAALSLHRPVAGKTGTTDRARDAWFVGYSPEIVAGVWVGFDDRQPLGSGEEGARSAVPIWTNFMAAAVRSRHLAPVEFPRPEGVTTARIDPVTGMLAPEGFPIAIDEVFLAGTEPHDLAPTDAGAPPADVPTTDVTPSENPTADVPEAPLVLPVETAPAEATPDAAADAS